MAEEQRRLYPLFLDIRDRLCVVVGGGQVAARKVRELLQAEARIRVVAPRFVPVLENEARIELRNREISEEDVAGALLVFAATNDLAVNRQVTEWARQTGALVNDATSPGECDFFVPASVKRGPLRITVSTQGAAPALTRRIREELETGYPEEYSKFTSALGKLREHILSRGQDPSSVRKLLGDAAGADSFKKFCRLGEEEWLKVYPSGRNQASDGSREKPP